MTSCFLSSVTAFNPNLMGMVNLLPDTAGFSAWCFSIYTKGKLTSSTGELHDKLASTSRTASISARLWSIKADRAWSLVCLIMSDILCSHQPIVLEFLHCGHIMLQRRSVGFISIAGANTSLGDKLPMASIFEC